MMWEVLTLDFDLNTINRITVFSKPVGMVHVEMDKKLPNVHFIIIRKYYKSGSYTLYKVIKF